MKRLLLAIVLAATLAVAACGGSDNSGSSGSSSSSTTTTAASDSGKGYELRVGYIGTAGLFTGPEGFAYSKGQLQQWLEPAGVTGIKVAGFANGPLLTAALVGGSLDVGLVGDTPALIGKSQDVPARLINQGQVNLAALVVAKKSITSLDQLAGKTIARQQASYLDRYIQGLLAEKGLLGKPKLVAMLNAQSVPALQAGSLDAVVVPAWQASVLLKQGFNVVADSKTTPSLQGTSVTEATNKILAAHPTIADAWNAARTKAIAYAKAHESEYYTYIAKAQGVPTAADAKKYLPLDNYPTEPFTPAGLKQLQGTLDFLVAQKQAKAFPISDWQLNAS